MPFAPSKNGNIPLIVTYSDSDTVVINYPGRGGDISGFNDKYGKVAAMVNKNHGHIVVQMGNRETAGDYAESVAQDLRDVIDWVKENLKPKSIYLAGASAGASAICEVAHEYKQVEAVLLIAPSKNAEGWENICNFDKPIFILEGGDDEIVSSFPKDLHNWLRIKNQRCYRHVCEGANHQFHGKECGICYSAAYNWLLGNKYTLDLSSGIELY